MSFSFYYRWFLLTISSYYDRINLVKTKEKAMEKMLLDSNIKDYVLGDEKLLWRGKPVKNIKLLPGEKFNIFFGVILTVFAIAWMALAFNLVSQTDNVFSLAKIFPAFGVPFLLVGFYFSLVIPIRIVITRKNIEYALTNKRVLILYNGKKQVLNSYNYTEIKNVNFGCDEQGVGFVTFTGLNSNGKRKHAKVNGFYNVAEVKTIYKIFSTRIGE